ncbi:organic cation/carnitine transporter 3-like [Silene latifolia]|uniref:organic cation/carnitine transporter 3-like n=1 Tax=Silene latifolia TaxID=37657 RepID=UPI003D7891B3
MDRVDSSTEEEITVPLLLSVDEIIEQSIGRLNFTQILQIILVSLPSFFDSQQTFISVFAHAQPTWHCTGSNTSCASNSNLCDLSKTEWAWDSGNVYTSIISEWNLQCLGSIIAGMPGTAFFIGCFLGGLLLATLGDSSLGRKNLLCISSLVMSVAALASAFSPNVWVYSVFRFLCGIGRAPVAICALVLLTERVSKRWRAQAAMAGFVTFSLGILGLTGIAFLTRDFSWRTLYLWTSVPGIISSVLCYLFLYESPRWLLMQGREKDAMAVLRGLGSDTIISPSLLNAKTEQKLPKTNPFISLKILLSRRWAVKRLIASMLLAFGIGLIFFGMFLGVGNLGFDIYLTSVFNAILTLFSYLLTFLWWIQHCNRRSSLLGFCTISGATCLIFSVMGTSHKGILISLEIVSLFCASMANNLVLMYMVELFPTCVRNSGSSLVRQAMILGSVFDPMLVMLGTKNIIYSYGTFGLVMLLCGFLVLWLSETRGKVLCDTMEEQELVDQDTKLLF